ncbi:hypothetical protein BLOT_000610 [Blomia tropicalis]|nr:hypothetical protein BLOT_000610 [Blomia tropicalis]
MARTGRSCMVISDKSSSSSSNSYTISPPSIADLILLLYTAVICCRYATKSSTLYKLGLKEPKG